MTEPDLTPRPPAELPAVSDATPSKRKKAGYGAILVLILTGLGVLLYTTLSGASLFFLNVDEAVERRDDLGTERFRIQGITVPQSIDRHADILDEATGERATAVVFQIAFNGEVANVVHRGGLADMFADCLPVILEGRWAFASEDLFTDLSNDSSNDSSKNRELFQAELPHYFLSSEMLVKHDNNYIPPDEDEENAGDNNYAGDNPAQDNPAQNNYKQDNPDRIESAVRSQSFDPLGGCPQA